VLPVTLSIERETAYRYVILNAVARHHLESRRRLG
jgi:hypothetical protein